MSNMSYCRFRNTLEDLRDCWDNLYDIIDSKEEQIARNKLIILCANIASEWSEDDLEEGEADDADEFEEDGDEDDDMPPLEE
jgi:hypothetical protein